MRPFTSLLLLGVLLLGRQGVAAEVLLPQNRGAFHATESIEIAIVGLPQGTVARVELQPQKPGASPVKFPVQGDGSTVMTILPPLALAPNVYTITLDGKEAGKLTVTSGVHRSTMLVSQTSTRGTEGGANFILGNAFSFGLLDAKGLPERNVRGKRSPGLNAFENAVAADLPLVVYMYWTGYVTHKPFGSDKGWANESMNEAMRLLSFHTAQRLRRYGSAIPSVGPIDEPGLGWGRTPAGGEASGFPDWDEEPWWTKRGWKFTSDIAAQSDADWMKYLTLRTAIIRENYEQAKKDLKTVWPKAVWSGDLYAPHAIMDGTDPLAQQINDVPASHVFFDFFGGPLSATGQMYLEKAHAPVSKLAHAMNGQLTGVRGPQRPLYHLLMNSMLAAGLHSNWWLNTGDMTKDDLAAVNGPAERLGPLFQQMAASKHDVALLWSFTEIGMREKDVCAREAKKKTGEQIKLLLPLPQEGEWKETEIATSAYEVGEVYTRGVLDMHQVLRRAGYPAHIVHERLLPGGALKNYERLILVGQTFDFPAEVRQAIADFVRNGGKVLVDRSTTVKLDGALVIDADFGPNAVRARKEMAVRMAKATKTKREASVFETSNHLNEPHRAAVPAVKVALAKTASRPVLASDDVDLSVERHTGGEGTLVMVLNGHEKYPERPDAEPYPRYNYAPTTMTYTLPGLPKGGVVYAVDGLNWDHSMKLEKYDGPLKANFEAGEMKLYLAAPREPGGFELTAMDQPFDFLVTARLKGVKMPWPFTLTITAPDGREIHRVHRATGVDGSYSEKFPKGANVAPGDWTVKLASPIGGFTAEAETPVGPIEEGFLRREFTTAGPVRVFDEEAMYRFLATKPSIVIAIGGDTYRHLADDLAERLQAKGIKAMVRSEGDVVHKVAYPRVWDPYCRLYQATGDEKKPTGEVKREITLGADTADWRTLGTLATVGDDGYLDWSGDHEIAYEPGCKLYVDEKRQVVVLKGERNDVKTTAEFRAKWAKPWQRLTSHVGGYQLPAQLPEAYTTDSHLILLGDSNSGFAVAALQASELLPQTVDGKYPGRGNALLSFVWSPFAVEKDVILIGASDADGVKAGIAKLAELTPK